MELAAAIRAHRVDRGMRQLDLARRLKVTLGSVSRWERGQCLPNLGQFRQLCLVLQLSADAVLRLPKRPPRRVFPQMRRAPQAEVPAPDERVAAAD
jgi:transcriptional regulator with XRE-family HTH domain